MRIHVVQRPRLRSLCCRRSPCYHYDHVSLDEVAARAGVTKVIVYRHFGSKKDVTGDPDIRAFHAGMRDTARSAIAGLLAAETTLRVDPRMLEPVAELLRSAMTGLALWWLEHRDVPRTTLVAAITQTAWHGLASRR
jgi:AcrR family transcriptional regulator